MRGVLVSVPVHMAIFYYYSYPKLFLWLSMVHFMIIAFVGWSLIGSHGAVGASLTVLIGQVVNFTIPALWVIKKIRNK